MKTIYFSLPCRFPMRRNLGWLTQPGLISLLIIIIKNKKIKSEGKIIIERERGTKR
jgi:hypothetical protein